MNCLRIFYFLKKKEIRKKIENSKKIFSKTSLECRNS